MHTLSEADIQKLTLNAVTALVASPHIKSKEKIDTVNFALQWFVFSKLNLWKILFAMDRRD